MWDYSELIAKAKLYNGRADSSSDEEFGIWLLLGLEFLLRAPLAAVHPSLLAEPTGPSILSANGITTTGDPKSVKTTTVLERLEAMVGGFGGVKNQAARLINLRNGELHSSTAVFANVSKSDWLGAYYEVVDVTCRHLNIPIADLLPDSIIAQASGYAMSNRDKVKNEVAIKISTAQEFLAALDEAEIARRSRLVVPSFLLGRHPWEVDCPACGKTAILETEIIRSIGENFDESSDMLERSFVHLAKSFVCSVCELRFDTLMEIEAAGLPAEQTETVQESLVERYSDEFREPDYGND